MSHYMHVVAFDPLILTFNLKKFTTFFIYLFLLLICNIVRKPFGFCIFVFLVNVYEIHVPNLIPWL